MRPTLCWWIIACIAAQAVTALASNPKRELKLIVVFGDKESRFVLQDVGEDATLEYSSNMGEHRKVSVKEADFRVLLEKATRLSKKVDRTPDCPREKIELFYQDAKAQRTESLVCLNGKNTNLKPLVQMVNLLATKIQVERPLSRK